MGSPISKETFLQRAKTRFGERYDYSEMKYKSYKTPIQIHCTVHPVKVISITPEKHLQTSGGCKYCLRESRIRMLERELHREPAIRESFLVSPHPEEGSPDAGSPSIPVIEQAIPTRPTPASAPPPR